MPYTRHPLVHCLPLLMLVLVQPNTAICCFGSNQFSGFRRLWSGLHGRQIRDAGFEISGRQVATSPPIYISIFGRPVNLSLLHSFLSLHQCIIVNWQKLTRQRWFGLEISKLQVHSFPPLTCLFPQFTTCKLPFQLSANLHIHIWLANLCFTCKSIFGEVIGYCQQHSQSDVSHCHAAGTGSYVLMPF